MKRSNSRPIILNLPTYEMHSRAAQPRILPFPDSRADQQPKVKERDESDAELDKVRERLFRMIVANQWDHSHGNRAS